MQPARFPRGYGKRTDLRRRPGFRSQRSRGCPESRRRESTRPRPAVVSRCALPENTNAAKSRRMSVFICRRQAGPPGDPPTSLLLFLAGALALASQQLAEVLDDGGEL